MLIDVEIGDTYSSAHRGPSCRVSGMAGMLFDSLAFLSQEGGSKLRVCGFFSKMPTLEENNARRLATPSGGISSQTVHRPAL